MKHRPPFEGKINQTAPDNHPERASLELRWSKDAFQVHFRTVARLPSTIY